MKVFKIILSLLLAIIACLLIFFSINALDLSALLKEIVPLEEMQQDAGLEKAVKRINDCLADGNQNRALRSLNRLLDDYPDKVHLDVQTKLDLFFYRNNKVMLTLGVYVLFFSAALAVSVFLKQQKHQTAVLVAILVASLYAGIYIVEDLVGVNSMLMTVLKKGAIYALLAVSMNLLNGFTGLFSLGQAGFMLVGAYAYAIFTIENTSRAQVYQYYQGGLVQFTLPTLVAILLAGLVAAFFAFLIGLPVLRLKSDYLAIATLGFAEIIRAVLQYDGLGRITNGSNLLRKFTTFNTALFPFAVSGICIALIALLIHSTYGRSFKAIRDDEVAAEAMGINLFVYKQLAFVISSFFAGIGGALLAMYQTTVQAAAFTSAMTYEILLIVVIGGMGSISGSILASFLFIASSEWWLRFLDNVTYIGTFKVPFFRSGFRMVVFSVIIMVVVLFYRKGIMGDKEFSLKSLMEPRKGGKRRG